MNKQTWIFHETATIPGIPGEWHAGLDVDIDTDAMAVLDVRLRDAPQREEVQQQIAPQETASTKKKTNAVEKAEGA